MNDFYKGPLGSDALWAGVARGMRSHLGVKVALFLESGFCRYKAGPCKGNAIVRYGKYVN